MHKRARSEHVEQEHSKKSALEAPSSSCARIEYSVLPTLSKSCGDVTNKRVLVLSCESGSLCFQRLQGNPALVLAIVPNALHLPEILNVSYLISDPFIPLSLSDGPFDVVILNFILSRARSVEMLQIALHNARKHLAPQGLVVINHTVGLLPSSLRDNVTEWLGIEYSPLPFEGADPATPYEAVTATDRSIEHYYPLPFLEKELAQAGFVGARLVPWEDCYPEEYVRKFPREQLQSWLDQGNDISYQLVASGEPVIDAPPGPYRARDYRVLWHQALRAIGHLQVEKFGSSYLLTLGLPEDGGTVTEHLTGFTFGCNTCLAETLCGDKKLTHSVLSYAGVPVVEHLLISGVKQANFALSAPRWPDVLQYFHSHGDDVVLKDTHGKSGRSVYRARNVAELECAFYKLQTRSSLVITPFVPSDSELRILVFPRLKDPATAHSPRRVSDFELATPLLWRKQPLRVVGDGVRTLAQLVQATCHAGTAVSSVLGGLGEEEAARVLLKGEAWQSWLFNHSQGSEWRRQRAEDHPEACQLAIKAARALGLWYGAIDILQPQGVILEVNHQIVTDLLDVSLQEATVIARATLSLRTALKRECLWSAAEIAAKFVASDPLSSSSLTSKQQQQQESKNWQQNNAVRRKLFEEVWRSRGARTASFDYGYLLLAQPQQNDDNQNNDNNNINVNGNNNHSNGDTNGNNNDNNNHNDNHNNNNNYYWNVLYDFGAVFSTDADITSSKALCSVLLKRANVPCVPHDLLFSASYEESKWGLDSALQTLKQTPFPCVLKPDGGSGGYGVVVVDTLAAAETALLKAWSAVCVSPFVRIEAEYRCVTVGGKVIATLSKERPMIVGDGTSTVAELLARWANSGPRTLYARVVEEWAKVTSGLTLWSVPSAGQQVLASWKHNLDCGSKPFLCPSPPPSVVEVAERAAVALGLLFCAVDVIVESDSSTLSSPSSSSSSSLPPLVLEVNSTPMWNQTAQYLPQVARACVQATIDVVRHSCTKPA